MPKVETGPFIPPLDLPQQHAALKDELEQAIQRVFATCAFVLGPPVAEFENQMAGFVGCRHALGVASGSDALRLALAALEIGPGDEVITTAFSFIATANTISHAGATPVFVDIDEETFNLDLSLIEQAVTPCTRAIVPVHLYGLACDMEEVLRFGRAHDLFVIEDCAQAIGATWDGRSVGSFGHLGCLSFYPTKNLGSCGDAGMIVTNDSELAAKIDVLRRQGSPHKYVADRLGFNSRLDSLQAAILGVKLRYLDRWNARRQELARRYSEFLAPIEEICTPRETPSATHVYHQYTIRTAERDRLKCHLEQQGIGSMIYYPVGIHRQPVYAQLGYAEGSLPITERASSQVLSLPIYPELSKSQQDRIIAAVRAFFGE